MRRSFDDLDLDLELELDALRASPTHKAARAATAPFRVLATLAKGAASVLTTLIAIVVFPIRLAIGLVLGVIAIAADLTYGIWRTVMVLVGLVAGVLLVVLKILDATVGNLLRLTFGLVFGLVKLILKIVTLGKFGKKGAVAIAATSMVGND